MQRQHYLKFLTDELQMRRFVLIKIAILATAFFLCCALDAPAQGRRKNIKRKTISKTAASFQVNNQTKQNLIVQPLPVTVLNAAETDFLSGEASVAVNPKQPTVVRLGLAQNAVSIVEFPASDGIYYIHEGNPKFASVFQSPTRETDRSITIYPGEGFVIARDGGAATPSATITLQMRSGLVLILELVPVTDLRKNAHRCVINYNRDDVVAARRAAGLAYNLGEGINPNNGRNTRASSKLVGAGDAVAENDSTGTNDANLTPVNFTSLELSKGSLSRKTNEKSDPKKAKTGLELSRLVNRRLADCLKNPAKMLGKWSEAKSGLSLAVSSVSEIDAEQRLVVVAVRNETTANLRLVPGTPEVEMNTVDARGNALQTERLERIYVETTSSEGLILPGSVSYYALVYNAPVMGASQRLKVLVSHREAADKPSSVSLSNASADKE